MQVEKTAGLLDILRDFQVDGFYFSAKFQVCALFVMEVRMCDHAIGFLYQLVMLYVLLNFGIRYAISSEEVHGG